jgi:hypothetical protein
MPRGAKDLRGFMAACLTFWSMVTQAVTAAQEPDAKTKAKEAQELFVQNVKELIRAAGDWQRRAGPDRRVVDQVCLVSDFAGFLEALSAWDDHHFFPILFDDVETTFKFLRAFQPARVVRLARAAAPIPTAERWERAVAAVARSWSEEGAGGSSLRGDTQPIRLGLTPPGLIFTGPADSAFAGAVALAAGRFEPLVRWQPSPPAHGGILTRTEANALAQEIERLVSDRLPIYGRLADDCDFLTFTDGTPFRYDDGKEGGNAFDDLVGRGSDPDSRRWAFTGRLIGDPPSAVYRAMCSLFLQPRSALLFNSYDDTDPGRGPYSIAPAEQMITRRLPVTKRAGLDATLDAWHAVFDPVNRFGWIQVNSSGGATFFDLRHSQGNTADIPPSEPTAVVMIHSFSAEDPTNPDTLAGRWLAQGAFAYYGAMNEPFLEAFQTPTLASAMFLDGVAMSAAVRQIPPQTFHKPWRLVYLGDPLFHYNTVAPPPRIEHWEPVASWPAYAADPPPAATATDDVRLAWALRTALFLTQRDARTPQPVNLAATLLAIRRKLLPPKFRPIHDALLADILLAVGRTEELQRYWLEIPPSQRSPIARRLLESGRAASFQRLISAGDFPKALDLWKEMIHTPFPGRFAEQATARLGALADRTGRLEPWRRALRAAMPREEADPATIRGILEAELKRVESQLQSRRSAR